MNIDLHCHAKLSPKSRFNLQYFVKIQQAAIDAGLQAIALTEHFNTQDFEEVFETLDRAYPYKYDYYDAPDLQVFCGMEVDVSEGGRILLIGKRKDVREMRRELIPFIDNNSYPSLQDLTEQANRRGMLKIGAHPLCQDHPLGKLPGDLLKLLDALELNGKDFKKSGEIRGLAQTLSMPVAAGSDAHHWLQVGCVYNCLEIECRRVEQLKKCLLQGRFTTTIVSGISFRLAGAKIVKKVLA